MRTLPTGWAAQTDALHATSPFVWCWRLQLVRSPALVLYVGITNHRETLTLGAEVFHPWPMSFSNVEERSDGKLPEIELQISNRPRLLAQFLEDPGNESGMFGKQVTATVLNVQHTAQTWQFRYELLSVTLSDEAAALRLAPPNFLAREVPQDRHNPAHCRWRFGGEECGYVINAFAAYTSCEKSYAACQLRGLDMQNRRLPKLQPQRFGGFIGIPRS